MGVHVMAEGTIDNTNTTQTPGCTKDEYNVKIIKRKVSPKGLTNNLHRPKGEIKKKRKG
jgi:hypothetical protein